MGASEDKTQQPQPQGEEQQQAAGGEADLAQAYRDLARGEQAASAMEANLTNLESKLDAILAAVEDAEGKLEASQKGKTDDAKAASGDAAEGKSS